MFIVGSNLRVVLQRHGFELEHFGRVGWREVGRNVDVKHVLFDI